MNTELLISMESMNEVDLTKAITDIVANTIGVESVGVNPVQDFFGTYGMESAYEPSGKLASIWRGLKKFVAVTNYRKLKSEIQYISKLNPELVKDEETEVKVNLDNLKEVSRLLGDMSKYDTKNLAKKMLEDSNVLLEKIIKEAGAAVPIKVGEVFEMLQKVLLTIRTGFSIVNATEVSNITNSMLGFFVGIIWIELCTNLLVWLWLKMFKKKLTEEKMTEYAKEFDEKMGSRLKELSNSLRKATGVNLDSVDSESEVNKVIKSYDKLSTSKKINKDEKVKIVNMLKDLNGEEIVKVLDAVKPQDFSKVYNIVGKISKDLTSMGDTEGVKQINEVMSLLEVKKAIAISTLLQVLEDAKKY